MKPIIAHSEIVVDATRDEVWNALTDPALIRQYMFGTEVKTQWKEGTPISWKGEWKGKRYEDKGMVLRVKPRELLEYSHFSPLTGQPDLPEHYHIVSIRLAEQGGRVLLTLDQDNNANDKARKHSEDNWQAMLQGLKSVVEKK